MNKVKNTFCLFLFIISFIYGRTLLNNINIIDIVLKKEKVSFLNIVTNKRFDEPVSLLSLNDKSIPKNEETEEQKINNPKIYISSLRIVWKQPQGILCLYLHRK